MADRQLFILTVLLIGISIIFSYSLSSYIVVLFGYSDFHFVIRQSAFGLLSILIMTA
jgi:cell division protein FtsW